MRHLHVALLLAMVLPVAAAERPAPEASPQMPAYLDPAADRQVTIVKRGADTVEEYRAGGKLYMLKVTPVGGASYFLIDENGDGTMTRKAVP